MASKTRIHAVFPNYCGGVWVSYTFISLLNTMQGEETDTHAYALGRAATMDRARVSALLPNVLYNHTSKLFSNPCGAIVRRFAHRFRPGDVAYLWMNGPEPVVRKLQKRGLFVAREMINCTMLLRRRELRAAYALLGLGDQSGISDRDIECERADLLAADAVFCPNDFVLESVIDYGVPPERCIPTSYGWGEDRIAANSEHVKSGAGVDVLFAGTGDVRKGLPWLLEAWERAGIEGRLLLAGLLDDAVRTRYSRILARPDVCELGYVKDIARVYQSADIFCFPSWEEGGPMVTIEAMASGLPCIVTPMGGAGLVKDSHNGIIIRPGDVDGIAAAIRCLASNESARKELGGRALATARDFTWQAVGERRARALMQMVRARGSGMKRS
jgi:glycosyltransferase involved in cell wall biosynthesis